MAGRKEISDPEERLRIIREGEAEGVLSTCRRYAISRETYYTWKNRYEEGGFEALQPKRRHREDPELTRLRDENKKLKEIVAEKELALRIKEDLLKKTLQQRRSD